MGYKLKRCVTLEMLDNSKFDVQFWSPEHKTVFQQQMFSIGYLWESTEDIVQRLDAYSYYLGGKKYLDSYDKVSHHDWFYKSFNRELYWDDIFEESSDTDLVEECLDKVGLSGKTPHKSTGGKSKYYEVVLPQWLLDKQTENGCIMIEDLAEVMYGNDFNFVNVFKAQKRMFDMQLGGGKEGNTFEYDATKVKYYTDKQLEVFNRNK